MLKKANGKVTPVKEERAFAAGLREIFCGRLLELGQQARGGAFAALFGRDIW